MSQPIAPTPWINYDEAMALVRQLGDPALEQFVMRAVTVAIQRAMKSEGPAAPFDMLFLVETMVSLFEQRESLIRVLQGEDLRLWPED
jgi:hypothetical protein